MVSRQWSVVRIGRGYEVFLLFICLLSLQGTTKALHWLIGQGCDNMKTILIVEDDSNLSRGIAFSFARGGFAVHCAGTLGEGRSLLSQHTIDLVILDLNLPDGDGADFCKYVRVNSGIPIIMLTARDMETDELAGFAAGADDYITKPFSVSILRVRAENLLRRFEATSRTVIHSGVFKLDTDTCKLYRNNDEIPISTTEFRILRLFMGNIGKILPKEQITAAIWDNQEEYVDDNTISVNISRLRSKIEENPKKPTMIKTIHGIGYVWVGE